MTRLARFSSTSGIRTACCVAFNGRSLTLSHGPSAFLLAHTKFSLLCCALVGGSVAVVTLFTWFAFVRFIAVGDAVVCHFVYSICCLCKITAINSDFIRFLSISVIASRTTVSPWLSVKEKCRSFNTLESVKYSWHCLDGLPHTNIPGKPIQSRVFHFLFSINYYWCGVTWAMHTPMPMAEVNRATAPPHLSPAAAVFDTRDVMRRKQDTDGQADPSGHLPTVTPTNTFERDRFVAFFLCLYFTSRFHAIWSGKRSVIVCVNIWCEKEKNCRCYRTAVQWAILRVFRMTQTSPQALLFGYDIFGTSYKLRILVTGPLYVCQALFHIVSRTPIKNRRTTNRWRILR